jgi:hypothetical protein
MAKVLDAAVHAAMAGLRTMLPGKVVRYDAALQQADVQPLIKDWFLDEGEERVVEDLPVVPNVPVVFPGAGGFRVTFPVAVGDTVALLFSCSSLDRWLDQGGGPVDPGIYHRHALMDAVAIPGLRDFAHPLGSAPIDRMTIGKDTTPRIDITGTQIQAGGTAALALLAELASAISTYNSHTHNDPVSGVTGAPNQPASAATGTTVLKGG